MNKEQLNKKGKYLAFILRHKPEEAGIVLDMHGWAFVSELSDTKKANLSFEEIEEIVNTDDKGRYEFNHDKTMVRATQGHSIKTIEIEMEEIKPPQYLYHGTKEHFLDSIKKNGLSKMERQHVHLSENTSTANIVADRRKGDSVILQIDALRMYEDGFKFMQSKNGVWLVDAVPNQYIS